MTEPGPERANQNFSVVLVGCGAMSGEWLRVAAGREDLSIVGLVDRNPDAARARQLEFGLQAAHLDTSLEAALLAVKPDLVFDCTVPEAHAENALTAFRHGAQVLSEKPLAHDLASARAVVAAARRAGLTHAVVQNRRFEPQIRRLRAFLESGGLGEVTTLNADFYIGAHFGGFRDAMRHVLLLDMAIHTFDAARLMLGADPVSALCHEWNPRGSWYAHGASAACIFEMSDGSVFNYRGSWSAEGFPTAWESDWRVIGTRGSLRWDGAARLEASLVDVPGRGVPGGADAFHATLKSASIPPLEPEARIGGHAGVIADFVGSLRDGLPPETVSSDNIKSLAMVFAAIQSAERGCRVPVTWE